MLTELRRSRRGRGAPVGIVSLRFATSRLGGSELRRIVQLPLSVVTKIAAGEVIERPASVVKELLENSIDAGSSRIEVDLEQGGVDWIRVVDDGCGIVAEDLPLAFASHATSKLREADDLFRIGTLGFRGEALASIGGVAQVKIQSRPPEADHGAEITCHGGELSAVRPWNGSPGTRIEVRHLFFNTPVRRKFLKTAATELGHVCETLIRLALAYPQLHLVLRHNGRLVHEIPASATLKDRIGLFFGADVRDALLELQAESPRAALWGLIADPKCERGNSKLQYLFVNGRWIRDRNLGHALQEGYRGLLMTGRYAVAFLFLDVPPDQVDVNVHPTKSEVRFRDAQFLYHLLRSAVQNRLRQAQLIPQLVVPTESPPSRPSAGAQPLPSETTTAGDRTPSIPAPSEPIPPPAWMLPRPTETTTAGGTDPAQATAGPSALPLVGPSASPQSELSLASLFPPQSTLSSATLNASDASIPTATGAMFAATTGSTAAPANRSTAASTSGSTAAPAIRSTTAAESSPPRNWPATTKAMQVHDAYLVVETPEGMLVIDQHALHERILFEQLQRRVRSGQLEVQRLLIPELVDLLPEQARAVLDHRAELAQLGLEVEEFGGSTVLLSSYPALLGRMAPTAILLAVVDQLSNREVPPSREQLLHDLLATMACKAAVKAGDRLTAEEIDYLMALRDLAEHSHHCPHGRPTSLLFRRQELEKQFRRI